jgi:integrase
MEQAAFEQDREWDEIQLREGSAEDDAWDELGEDIEALRKRLADPANDAPVDPRAVSLLWRHDQYEKGLLQDKLLVAKAAGHRADSNLASSDMNDVQAAPSDDVFLDTDIVKKLAAERKITDKTKEAYRAVAEWFYERVGRIPVDRIKRADVLTFKNKLSDEGQSAANINTKLSRVRSLLQWAMDNQFASENVAKGISIKVANKADTERLPFDLAALRAIFESPVYASGERPVQGKGDTAYWLPLLALFTGARLEELGQLRTCDVLRRDYLDQEGKERSSWIIRITAAAGRLKNASSERVVPLHTELQRLGFLRLVESAKASGHERVFPLLTPGPFGRRTHKWGQWFGSYLREVCLVQNRRMTFHSFRHAFIDYARQPGIPEGVQRKLAGHKGKGVHDDYGEGYLLHWLVEAMALYRVPGLKLPNAPEETDAPQ